MSHRKTKRSKKVAWKLEDEDWDRIKNVFPVQVVGPEGGRPRADNRRVLEDLIWFARAGCDWEQMPKNFPSWSTCRRRLIEWEELGVLVSVHKHLALLDEAGKLRMEETFLNGSFVPANCVVCDQRSTAARTSGRVVCEGPRPERVR